MQRLENPRQERARATLALAELTKSERASVAVHLRRFMAALEHQRRFDRDVMASLERLARNPAFRERINQLLSTKDTSDNALTCRY
jgi:hypothetical protein